MSGGFGECVECGCPVERVGWDDLCLSCQQREDDERLDEVFEAQAAWLQQRPVRSGTPDAAKPQPPESDSDVFGCDCESCAREQRRQLSAPALVHRDSLKPKPAAS